MFRSVARTGLLAFRGRRVRWILDHSDDFGSMIPRHKRLPELSAKTVAKMSPQSLESVILHAISLTRGGFLRARHRRDGCGFAE